MMCMQKKLNNSEALQSRPSWKYMVYTRNQLLNINCRRFGVKKQLQFLKLLSFSRISCQYEQRSKFFTIPWRNLRPSPTDGYQVVLKNKNCSYFFNTIGGEWCRRQGGSSSLTRTLKEPWQHQKKVGEGNRKLSSYQNNIEVIWVLQSS